MTFEELYRQSLSVVSSLISQSAKSSPVDMNPIKSQLKAVLASIPEQGEDLLVLTHHGTSENYLISHCLNSAILAILMGVEMRLSGEDLEKLGIAALMHDAGMMKLFEKVNRPVKLTPEDFEEVKNHPIYSTQLFESTDMDPEISRAILEHHERENGSGYPRGLGEGEIHKLASIIAVADVYQALVHPRPHRQQLVPFQAIKEMMRLRQLFNPQALKVLLEVVSVFPLGTIVELDSGSLGKVVKINKKSLMSPQIELFFSRIPPLFEKRIVDLFNSPLNIQRCLTEEEMRDYIKKANKTQEPDNRGHYRVRKRWLFFH